MKNLSTEAKVGLFLLAGIAGTAFMATQLEPLKFNREKIKAAYYIIFDNVAGLEREAPVTVAGVQVGKVKSIDVLPDGKAKVKVIFTKNVSIYQNAYAVIETMGLMGEKYIEINPGNTTLPMIPPGSTITRGKSSVSTDQLMLKIYEVVTELNNSLVTPNGENRIAVLIDEITKLTETTNILVKENEKNIKKLIQNLASLSEFLKSDIPEIAENMKSVSAQMNEIVIENRNDMRKIVKNLKNASDSAPLMAKNAVEIENQAKEIAKKLDETITQLNDLLSGKNKNNIVATVENIKESTANLNKLLKKLHEGNGTIAKIINDEKLYKDITNATSALGKLTDKFSKTDVYVGFRGDINTRTGNSRGGISFTISPASKDRYYYFEIVSDSFGLIDLRTNYITDNSGNVTVQKEVRKSFGTEVTLQYARIFNDPIFLKDGKWVIRGGIIETTGGGGIDYLFPGGKLKLTSSMWEVDRQDPYGEDILPHLRIGLTYNINKNLYLYFGGDELLYDKYRGFYIGSGLRFGDDDIKYLMGSIPSLK